MACSTPGDQLDTVAQFFCCSPFESADRIFNFPQKNDTCTQNPNLPTKNCKTKFLAVDFYPNGDDSFDEVDDVFENDVPAPSAPMIIIEPPPDSQNSRRTAVILSHGIEEPKRLESSSVKKSDQSTTESASYCCRYE